ncbi:MAG: thioredoxin-disulfide reductase [Candidatus Gastranaerophilales bacterium]|nr:thioredoxin-disulfide reductase [Candidatus Gastranaerophilales bacterium]
MDKQVLEYDAVIIGGGPAGLSAGIYIARGNLKAAILDINMLGGQPTNYLEIENYPAMPLIGGFELMEQFEAHADKFGIEKFPMEEIVALNLIGKEKTVETQDKIFNSKAVIIATGAKSKKLEIPGEDKFIGRGVSYCAVCDGAFFKDKVICVIGGGNSAIEEAIYLTKFASKVYLIHRRDELRADKIIQERAKNNPKIEFVLDTVPLEIKGENKVESILVKNVKTGKTKELSLSGVFPFIGFTPNNELFKNIIKTDLAGFIETDETMHTNVRGIFAIGDVRSTPLRQVITAAADGAVAATYVIRMLEAE